MKVTIKNLNVTYNNPIFTEAECSFSSGNFNVIFGKSGVGKTTLLNILAGIEQSSKFEYLVDDIRINTSDELELTNFRRNHIAMIFQDFNIDTHLTVKQNIMAIANLKNQDMNKVDKRIDMLLKKLNLYDVAKKKVSKLSGGQKQRCAIARALINEPDIILADEPTGFLDQKTSKEIVKILKDLAKEKLVIVVTHDKNIKDDADVIYEITGKKIIATTINTESTELGINVQLQKDNKPSIIETFMTAFYNLFGYKRRNIFTTILATVTTMALLLNISISHFYEAIFTDMMNTTNSNSRIISVQNPMDPNGNDNVFEYRTTTLTDNQQDAIKALAHVEKLEIEYSFFNVTQQTAEDIAARTADEYVFKINFTEESNKEYKDLSLKFADKLYTENEISVEVETIGTEQSFEYSNIISKEEVDKRDYIISGNSLDFSDSNGTLISKELAMMLTTNKNFDDLLEKTLTLYANVPIYMEQQIVEKTDTKVPYLFPVFKKVPVDFVIKGVYEIPQSELNYLPYNMHRMVVNSQLPIEIIETHRLKNLDEFNPKQIVAANHNYIIVDSFENVQLVVEEINRLFPTLLIHDSANINQTIYESININLKILSVLAWIITIICIVLFGFITYLNYKSRKKQYAVYKIFGATRKQISILVMFDPIFTLFFGSIIGYFLARLSTGTVLQIILKGKVSSAILGIPMKLYFHVLGNLLIPTILVTIMLAMYINYKKINELLKN